jgi:hypothetical protein
LKLRRWREAVKIDRLAQTAGDNAESARRCVMPQWLIVISWVSVVLDLLTAGIIAADIIRHPQRMTIMNIVWPVTGLYFPRSQNSGPKSLDFGGNSKG